MMKKNTSKGENRLPFKQKKLDKKSISQGRKSSQTSSVGEKISGIFLILTLLFFALGNTGPIANNDYGLHLRIGEEIADSGKPVRIDNHSHTLPDAPYPDHEWLTQLWFYGWHKVFGNRGMVVLKGLLIGMALAFAAFSIREPASLRILILLPILFLGFDHSHMRPHLVSWVFSALLIFLLSRRRFPFIFLLLFLWGNMHGSVLLGVGFTGLFFLEEYIRTKGKKWILWSVAAFVVPLANPGGIGIYTLFFEITGHTSFIGEWKPYAPDSLGFWLLILVFGAGAIGFLKSKPLNPFDFIRILVLGFLGFQSSRNGVMAGIFLAPLLGKWYAPLFHRFPFPIKRSIVILCAGLIFSVLFVRVYQGKAFRFELDHEKLPVEAVKFIKNHELQGPMFNDYNFGGYFLWKAFPEFPVFIDGRTEVYKGGVLKEYLAVSNAEDGWKRIVEKYDVRFFVIRPERKISPVLLRDKNWELVYFDYNAVIYVRSDLFPSLKRLRVVSPYGHRDRTKTREATEEITYLLKENPRFFGGYKILAFLQYRSGNYRDAEQSLKRYLELHPEGKKVEETNSLIRGLKAKEAW